MRIAFLLFALPALVACATAGASDSGLEPGKWRFVAIDGKPPVSDQAHLTIDRERIGASVGCNGMGGDLKVRNGKLVVGGMVSTMMWCEGVMDQERAVSELLSADPEFRIEQGRLTLRGGGHWAELARAD